MRGKGQEHGIMTGSGTIEACRALVPVSLMKHYSA